MKWCFIVLFVFFSSASWANEPNTLIAVHKTEVNNKFKPNNDNYRKRGIRYRLINEGTSEIIPVFQKSNAIAIYLEPGNYCLRSMRIFQYPIVNFLNPLCFIVKDKIINNVGTWILGWRTDGADPYAIIVGFKDNYSELESTLKINDSIPVLVYKKAKK